MATYSKLCLSGSTNGKQIKLNATSGSGATDVHTAVSGTDNFDEIWLWAVNSSSSSVKLTIQWGEETNPDGNIEVVIPGESGLMLVVPGLLLQNSLLIKAYASTTNVILINGYVNRITS
jgi:hypothetical protein